MTEQEINDRLTKDYDGFMDGIYEGDVPDNILDLFEKAIMALPPFAHQINFYNVKNIISKKPEQLSNSDINDIIKVVLNVSLERLYDNLFVAIPEHIRFEKFVRGYNEIVENFKSKLKIKKATLKDLSSGILNKNGSRIVPGNDY